MSKHFIPTSPTPPSASSATPRRSRPRRQPTASMSSAPVCRRRPSTTRDGAQLQSPRLRERAFRSIKTVDLQIRPIHHRFSDRVRAHVLLCMLAYYLEWHMRQAWRRCCSTTPKKPPRHCRQRGGARAAINGRVHQAVTRRTDDGLPVHSFQSLLAELATVTRNTITTAIRQPFRSPAPANTIQLRAFQLLGGRCRQ